MKTTKPPTTAEVLSGILARIKSGEESPDECVKYRHVAGEISAYGALFADASKRQIPSLQRQYGGTRQMNSDPTNDSAALPRMACSALPDADYTESEFHFTITHTVWLGGASLCFCDTAARAELMARAFNGWLKTDDGQAWAKSILPQNDQIQP